MATEWLRDTFGPDGVRVTVGVEPAVERLVRERDAWTVARFSGLPARFRLRNAFPGLIQDRLLSDSWAVVVEADSGLRVRLTRPTQDEARSLAHEVSDSVRAKGVAALADLR